MKKLFLGILILLSVNLYADDFINAKIEQQEKSIDEITIYIQKMKESISILKVNNSDLENTVVELEDENDNLINLTNSLKENNGELQIALKSNKDDTHEIINILGDLTNDINNLNKQKEITNKFVQMTIPVTTLPLIGFGAYLYFATDEKTCGKTLLISGGSLLFTAELIWNGGKFILKVW